MARPARPVTLHVGGLVPLTTTDYPGKLAAVVFCQGCAWRCQYCHNPHLLAARGAREIPWTEVLAFLRRRAGLLDAVVFSGGEPTVQPALPDAMRTVREMGFKVGLHTAGSHPRRLEQVLPLADWVAMDVKAPFTDYTETTGVSASGDAAERSTQLILGSGVAHEFRTTVHPALLDAGTLQRLATDLASRGVRHYAVQEFRHTGTDCRLGRVTAAPMDATCAAFPGQFASFTLRRAA
jgi:pyruvate formate lyase activating enzyme